MTNEQAEAIAAISRKVKFINAKQGRQAAVQFAMTSTAPLLQNPSDPLRVAIQDEVFGKIPKMGGCYQNHDFEVVDYELYELAPDLPLFRGPPVPPDALASGDYFCVMGAAQTFGRLSVKPWPQQVSEAIGMPVLNLGHGGAGADFFLHPTLLRLASNARFVIIQVMSGRSVGTEDSPGKRFIVVDSKRSDITRRKHLENLWREDRNLAIEHVRELNDSYVDLYRRLRQGIDRPAALFWTSDRMPGGWKPETLLKSFEFGSFPQLIGRETYKRIAKMFSCRIKQVFDAVEERPTSRITGLPCPYMGADDKPHETMKYYPSSEVQAMLAQKIARWGGKVALGFGLDEGDIDIN
jgi:hypothetical protein